MNRRKFVPEVTLAMAAVLSLMDGANPPRRDFEAGSGMGFRPRDARERWKREVRRGRVVRHRR